MLWMKWKMVVDSLRGRRRRIPCSLWFLLLFAAGGLLLFIHQRDLSEMVQQQGPGQSPLLSLTVLCLKADETFEGWHFLSFFFPTQMQDIFCD